MREQTPQENPVAELLSEFNTKLREIEEKQKLIKDRVLLIGTNLVDIREETLDEIADLKRKTELLEDEIKKLKILVQRVIEMTNDFARKSELAILERQIDLFSPLEFARIKDVEKIVKEILKKKK